jgi:predicted membrane-bound mannosyltransferase
VGAAVAFFSNKTILANPTFARFLAFYTVILTAIYSLISYKTPWCALNFLLGMILLAGIGATALIRLCRKTLSKAFIVALLVAGTSHLAWEAWRASQTYASDRNNPYVYAQTLPDLLNSLIVSRPSLVSRRWGTRR